MPGFTRVNRRYNKNPSRRKIAGVGGETFRGRRTQIGVVSITHNAIITTHTEVVFDQPVQYTGVLPGWTKGATTVLAVTQTDAVTWTFTWSALIVATDIIVVPFEDPSFRNMNAGYVAQGSYEAA